MGITCSSKRSTISESMLRMASIPRAENAKLMDLARVGRLDGFLKSECPTQSEARECKSLISLVKGSGTDITAEEFSPGSLRSEHQRSSVEKLTISSLVDLHRPSTALQHARCQASHQTSTHYYRFGSFAHEMIDYSRKIATVHSVTDEKDAGRL